MVPHGIMNLDNFAPCNGLLLHVNKAISWPNVDQSVSYRSTFQVNCFCNLRVKSDWIPIYFYKKFPDAPLSKKLILIPAWISNHMPSKVWDEITYPYSTFIGFGKGWVISYHVLWWCNYLSMLGLQLTSLSKRSPRPDFVKWCPDLPVRCLFIHVCVYMYVLIVLYKWNIGYSKIYAYDPFAVWLPV